MAHIHTGPGQHDFTASAYIVRTDLPEPAIILHKHRILNQWMQFGGHVELHEDPWQALTHEIREESGYELSQLKLLQPDIRKAVPTDDVTHHPLPANIGTAKFGGIDHYHTDIAYAFTTGEDPAGKSGDGESSEFRTFTRDELAALTKDEIPPNVQQVALIILDDYVKNWKTVPATDI